MRIFLSGNEEAARWHLPIAQAKVNEFAARTEKSGFNQNTFTFLFEDTGTRVTAQYSFGQVSMQIHSPSLVTEEEGVEEEIFETQPKTFYVNTTQGYFWVEVRYVNGVPAVILTPFTATVTAEDGITKEFVYPGFALNAPGMIAGCFNDEPAARYVLAQNGGVMSGEGEDKGTINSTPIIAATSRITVIENSVEVHDYVLMENGGGKAAEIRRVEVSAVDGVFDIQRLYSSVDMMYEAMGSLSPAVLHPNPAWVHRKCNGSYFSPNKTIGYHADIGTDDDFLGNVDPSTGTDMLDNAAGFEEPAFNHTEDLYRLASLFSFPSRITEGVVEVVLVSPTMAFNDNPLNSKKCWGGYGLTQSEAGCVDYMPDFNSWLLSPRFVRVSINMRTGEKTFLDMATVGSSSFEFRCTSWDGEFSAVFAFDATNACDTELYDDGKVTEDAALQCAWKETCTDTCYLEDPGSIGTCPRGWTPRSHWKYFSREDLRIVKHAYFLFGSESPSPQNPSAMSGFYFLFDGLWHLDIGVHWVSSTVVGNHCGLCMSPLGSQVPGQNVVFALNGVDNEWALAHGREFVEDMEIVTPLGYVTWPAGGTVVGFVAKVPDEFASPHDPVLMIGGIEFPSQDVPGETLRCQRAIMSSPCICDDNTMVLDEYSSFQIGQSAWVQVLGGCPPYEISLDNANIDNKTYLLTQAPANLVVVEDECAASILVKDACGTEIELTDEYYVDGVVTGPTKLAAGETAFYGHNLGPSAVYTGDLVVSEMGDDGAILQMPEDAEGNYTVSWSGRCEITASMTVRVKLCPIPLWEIDALDVSSIPDVGDILMPCPGWAQPYRVVTSVTGPFIGCGTPLPAGFNMMTSCEYINAVAWVRAPITPSPINCGTNEYSVTYFIHMGDPGDNPCD